MMKDNPNRRTKVMVGIKRKPRDVLYALPVEARCKVGVEVRIICGREKHNMITNRANQGQPSSHTADSDEWILKKSRRQPCNVIFGQRKCGWVENVFAHWVK